MFKLRFIILFILPTTVFAQPLTINKLDNNKNSVYAYYDSNGVSDTGANLVLSYSLPIKNLNLKNEDRTLLEKLVKAKFSDIYNVPPETGDTQQAYRLAQTADVSLELIRGKKVYARCVPPKNFYGYGFYSTNPESDDDPEAIEVEPYVGLRSNALCINSKCYFGQKRPFRICKAKNGKTINPTVSRGDKIKLKQGNVTIVSGKFEEVGG